LAFCASGIPSNDPTRVLLTVLIILIIQSAMFYAINTNKLKTFNE
jgi:hypothetical protein